MDLSLSLSLTYPLSPTHLSLEVLWVGVAIEDLHKVEKDCPLLCNAVLLCYLVLKVGGEEMKRRDVSGCVGSEELEQSVYVITVRLAVDKEALD